MEFQSEGTGSGGAPVLRHAVTAVRANHTFNDYHGRAEMSIKRGSLHQEIFDEVA